MALPQGYREGLITAISVVLGFSLYFARWWNLEHPDEWTWQGVVPACIVGVGIVVQLIALYRSLDVRDENEARYQRTVQYFFSGVLIVLVGVVIVAIVS